MAAGVQLQRRQTLLGLNRTGSWAQLKDSRRNVRNSNKDKKKGFRVCCVSSTVSYPYKTLRIQPGATESEVKKAFRQLALQIIYTKEDPDQSRGFGFVTMSTVEEAEKAIELFHQHGAPSHQHIQKGSQRFQGSLEGFL